MEPKIIVVYDTNTKEIIACVPLSNGEKGILKNGVDIKLYGDAEPLFKDMGNGVITLADAFEIKL